MKEIYKDIPGYEGKYRISNLGNVLSLNYQNTRKPRVLAPIKHRLGYLIVHLGQSKIKMVHCLVATAFIPNPENKQFVNHIDGDKTNNNISNLEWVTSKENMEHAIRTGLRNPHENNHPKGVNVPNHKPVLQYTTDGKLVKRWECISDAARAVGCKPASIINNIAGYSKTLHGFIWKRP